MPLSPPREVKFQLLFFKSLAGLGVGAIGMIILVIFVLIGLGSVGTFEGVSPFLIFSAIVMGFIVSLVTNFLGAFIFGMFDREKYPEIRGVLRHIILLNIIIFVFLLPVYLSVIIGTGDPRIVFLVAAVQLIVSSFASMLTLDLSNSTSSRENFIAVYGIVFAVLLTTVLMMGAYWFGQFNSSAADLAKGGNGGKGVNYVLFAVLPTMWFLFGFFTGAVEMIYRWIYKTWGLDSLNKMS